MMVLKTWVCRSSWVYTWVEVVLQAVLEALVGTVCVVPGAGCIKLFATSQSKKRRKLGCIKKNVFASSQKT